MKKNIELKMLYSGVVILEVIRRERLRWAGHARRIQNPLLRAVIAQNSVRKRPLRRPRMRLGGFRKNGCGTVDR